MVLVSETVAPLSRRTSAVNFHISSLSHESIATCMRHRDQSGAQAIKALSSANGVTLINDRTNNRFPTPLDASHQDDVFVGRVRRDISRSGALVLLLPAAQLTGSACNPCCSLRCMRLAQSDCLEAYGTLQLCDCRLSDHK